MTGDPEIKRTYFPVQKWRSSSIAIIIYKVKRTLLKPRDDVACDVMSRLSAMSADHCLHYYLLLNALSRRRREVNHVSFACAIPHVIIKFVA